MDIYDKINVHVTEISGDTLKFEIDGDFEEVAEETSSQPETPKESVTVKPEQTTPKVTIETTTIRKNQTVSKFKKRKPTLKVKAKKKRVKLLIGKVVGATKYQVRYKQGKKWKTKYTKSRALTIKKLKSKKKVKIQVRAVMVYEKKKVYGLWVKKSVRVK